MRILLAQINPTVGAIEENLEKILKAIEEAKKKQCDLVLTPELALTGYPPEDFLLLSSFQQKTEESLNKLIEASKDLTLVVGTLRNNSSKGQKPLFNTAAICSKGKLLGYQDKALLPTYDVFDEHRYFEPGKEHIAWKIDGKNVGITICEDIWQHSGVDPAACYDHDPIQAFKSPLDILLNLSASPYHFGKFKNRIAVATKAAKTLKCPLFLCNQVGGNDSLIFDGRSLVVDAQGKLSYVAIGFKEELSIIHTDHLSPIEPPEDGQEELLQALTLGIKDYFHKLGFKKACLGLSGGIDSALVACLAVKALGENNVIGIAMPSRYSSKESLEDAKALADNLQISLETIPIEDPFQAYLTTLEPFFKGKKPDITEENLQARVRGMILMALSNKHGYIVLSTGNKSELAMGYSTLYGDLCGGLAAISDLTKDQVYALSRYINKDKEIIPSRTLTKEPSAELRPNQKDSDSLPPYPIIDTVLREYIEKGKAIEEISKQHGIPLNLVKDLVKRIHGNEYKRRQSPPGLRVTEKAFSIGRKFPIVQGWTNGPSGQ